MTGVVDPWDVEAQNFKRMRQLVIEAYRIIDRSEDIYYSEGWDGEDEERWLEEARALFRAEDDLGELMDL